MRIHELLEGKEASRAGIYPYYINEDGIVHIFMMIPSDPAYGGSSPQLAKGRVDPGENVQETAIREGEEELGLKRSNLKSVSILMQDTIQGYVHTCIMAVYCGEVIDPNDFGKYHYETGWAGWLTIDDALTKGRKTQSKYVQALKSRLTNNENL